MEFHEWSTFYGAWRSNWREGGEFSSAEDYYRGMLTGPRFKELQGAATRRLEMEASWFHEGRPYYSVYPSIVEALVRLRLDIDGCKVPSLPLPALAVRFAKGHELVSAEGRKAQAVLLCVGGIETNWRRLAICVDFGERTTIPGVVRDFAEANFFWINLRPGETVEQSLVDAATEGRALAHVTEVTTFLKLACTLCLLGQDPEIIEPDVLAKDREKWEHTHDPAIVERAVRRGKRGWLVGAKLEIIPHVRRPHMALRWTGPGGATPRIVPVKGSIVHREKVEHVPTGRLDADAQCDQG